MPGMSGFGQIFGSMGRGMAGGLGAGRGGSAGGQGALSGAQGRESTAEVGSSDLYDVDRWQRAEKEQEEANREYADTGMSALEQVRREWENKSAKKTSRLKKLLRKDTDTGSAKPRGAAPPEEYTGTQHVHANPARKMLEERPLSQVSEIPQKGDEERYAENAVNGYSVPAKSNFERFFSSNPVNSTILCGDSLSMGPLTMNQLYRSFDSSRGSRQWSHNSDTGYMDNLRENSQRRKYEVHIVNED